MAAAAAAMAAAACGAAAAAAMAAVAVMAAAAMAAANTNSRKRGQEKEKKGERWFETTVRVRGSVVVCGHFWICCSFMHMLAGCAFPPRERVAEARKKGAREEEAAGTGSHIHPCRSGARGYKTLRGSKRFLG